MSTTDELLQKGIGAAKAGQVAQARSILKQIIEQEPRNETAWLWLSGVVETDEQRIICLENVLAINPHNKAAQRGLNALRQKTAAIKPLPEVTPAKPPTPSPVMSRPQITEKPKPILSRETIGCSIALVVLLVAFIALALIADKSLGGGGAPVIISTPKLVPTATPKLAVGSDLVKALQGWSEGQVLSVKQRDDYLYIEFEFIHCADNPNTIDCSLRDVQGMLWTLFDEYEDGRYAQDVLFCALNGHGVAYTIKIGYNKCRSQNNCAVYEEADVLKAAIDFHAYSPYYTSLIQTSGPKLSLLSVQTSRSPGGGYFVVEGEVKNISSIPLDDVVAVVTVYDGNRNFIASDTALIEYTTLLPGQTSPFEVMVDYNPKMEYYKVEFKHLLGGIIQTRRDDRSD